MEPAVRPILLFTRNGCHSSMRVRACLSLSGVPFVERYVSTNLNAAHALAATGIFATPLVIAADHLMLVARRNE